MSSNVIMLPKTKERPFSDLLDCVPLFHSPDGEGYAVIEVNGHKETWPLNSIGFRHWVDFKSYEQNGRPLPTRELNQIIRSLKARAQFGSPEIPVFTRLAFYNGSIYLDLCNGAWEAIEISANGWQIDPDPPVRFIRSPSMLPLPHPIRGGSLEELKNFTNTPDPETWIPCVSWALATMNPKGPFPILNVEGGAGWAKTTTVRMTRALIDPSAAPLRSSPNSVRDLMIASKNSYIICFDNLSEIPSWLSDALCRLATGSGFATRRLYTDAEEVIINTMRPIIINGIDFLPHRQDFIDRSLVINLPAIPDEKRKPIDELWKGFEIARPRILGALLDTVSFALSNLNNVELKSYPRMADFAKWAISAECKIGLESGSFLKMYENNRRFAIEDSLERSIVASAVRNLFGPGSSSKTTATELLKQLEDHVSHNGGKIGLLPKTPSQLSGTLRRAQGDLLSVGIEVLFPRESGTGKRFITIRCLNS